jgi:hypothetical protein
VSYRDETWMLRDRLGELETEHARLSGRRAGLKVALAEEETRLERARRELSSIPIRHTVKLMSARTAGIAALLVALALAGVLLVTCGEAIDDVDRDYTLTVADSNLDGLAMHERCTLSIVEDDAVEHEPCAGTLRCGDREVYRGRGACEVFFDEDLLEYWDHGPRSEPGLILVESEHRAVFRHDATVVAFTTP